MQTERTHWKPGYWRLLVRDKIYMSIDRQAEVGNIKYARTQVQRHPEVSWFIYIPYEPIRMAMDQLNLGV